MPPIAPMPQDDARSKAVFGVIHTKGSTASITKAPTTDDHTAEVSGRSSGAAMRVSTWYIA